jgi:two-component system, LytTR family, response regulator
VDGIDKWQSPVLQGGAAGIREAQGDRPAASAMRVIIADDERPARAFLAGLIRANPDVELVGEAATGTEAVTLIERLRPDLALLDLQMPEVDGLGVVRLLRKPAIPLIAFVTAYDEYAVRAFEANAIDYLLKPVEPVRLRRTLTRAQDRLEHADYDPSETQRLAAAAASVAAGAGAGYLRRIPVRRKDDIIIVPIEQLAAVVAHGELLRLTTVAGHRYVITYRLKDLEARLDPAQFVRLSRGTLVNLGLIQRVSPMPGGTYVVTLATGQQLPVSRLRARALRDSLLRL